MREDIFVFLGILDPSSRMSACSPELHLLKQTNRLQVVTEIKKKKKKTEKEMRSWTNQEIWPLKEAWKN